MQIIASIDPVTRIEGHLKVEVSIETLNGVQQVVDAKSIGTLFRGFESILVGRDPRDAQHITERICGVCPVSHAMAAVLALDKAANLSVPANARILRNLVMGANFLDSHILHFYLLALPDFLDGPAMHPWSPGYAVDKRIDTATGNVLLEHYLQAIAMRRKAHEMCAIFGGRMPHPPTFIPGGITASATKERLDKFSTYLNEVSAFIQNVYLADVQLLSSVYSDYYSLGRGPENLLAYGCFDLDAAASTKLLKRGRLAKGAGSIQEVAMDKISEQLTHSWYENSSNNLNPANSQTKPQNPKANAYSWLKAPRYDGKAYEVGPLARMTINGDYSRGISVMDRHQARAKEALKIAQAMKQWIQQVQVGAAVYTRWNTPGSATSIGLTEAPRGALGHWLNIANSKISHYQIVTPSCWNCSPRDDNNLPGPLEAALIGMPVQDASQPIEVLRVVHSFDPCLDCAVHVLDAQKGSTTTILSTANNCSGL